MRPSLRWCSSRLPIPEAPLSGRFRGFCSAPRPASSEPFVDRFGRRHTYLRVSLTERCNLRCTYCMPAEGVQLTPKSHLLSTEEYKRLTTLFAEAGVSKFRFTGGEPLIHRDVSELVRHCATLPGVSDVALTTNGLLLSRQLPNLVESGLTAVNISLDTLDPLLFPVITRNPGHHRVMQAIKDSVEALAPGSVKVNCVVIRGVNDNEVVEFVRLTENLDVEVRFIEYMPFDDNKWADRKLISYFELLDRLKSAFPEMEKARGSPSDTSKVWRVPGFKGRVGFISSMTDHFCGGCNRLRLMADGNLKVCLFGSNEVNLLEEIRSGASSETLNDVIRGALSRKKFKHDGLNLEELSKQKNRPMVKIGG